MFLAEIDADATAMENLAKNPPPGYPGLVTSYPDFSSAYAPSRARHRHCVHHQIPTTSLLVTVAPVIPGDVGVTLQNELIDWAKTTYPRSVRNHDFCSLRHDASCMIRRRRPSLFPRALGSLYPRDQRSRATVYRPGSSACPPSRSRWRTPWNTASRWSAIYIEVYEGDLTSR